MVFKSRIYRDGEERVRTFFAWLPVTVYGYPFCETRWLTTVTIRQRFRCVMTLQSFWVNVAFECP
jgi:hypothetical protein